MASRGGRDNITEPMELNATSSDNHPKCPTTSTAQSTDAGKHNIL